MHILQQRFLAPGIATLALWLGLSGLAPTSAQEGTPVVPEAATTPYPVTIHHGTCAVFDPRPAYVLEAAPREGEHRGASAAPPVMTMTATLEVGFDDLLGNQPHAVLVLPSREEFGPPVACGDLGGVVADGTLVVALQPVAGAALAGLAVLTEQAGLLQLGDDQTDVAIHVFAVEDPEAPTIGTPEPVAAAGEGFAQPEWLVDAAWLEQNLDRPDVHVLRVQDPEAAAQGGVPGAWQVVSDFLLPADTSEETLQLWREDITLQLNTAQMGSAEGAWRPNDTIVLYDNGTMEAAVFWWVLDYVGHEDKRIFNGGWQAWADHLGIPDDTGLAAPPAPAGGAGTLATEPTPYPAQFREEVLATLDEVAAVLADEQVVLVDTRSSEEYAAGHIPGAVNVPATANFVDGSAWWRDATALQERYAEAGVASERTVITYGDAGPGAAAAYVALRLLGHEDVALYPGGWDEWNRYPELPRATAEPTGDS